MKTINGLVWYEVDGSTILIVSNEYKGKPEVYCKYDVLIINKKVFDKYQSKLIPEHIAKHGWTPSVIFIKKPLDK